MTHRPRTTELPSPPPLHTNVAAVVWGGTAVWALALVAALVARDWLEDHDALWWIWVAVAGVAVGLTWGPYALWKQRGVEREIHRAD